MGVILFGKSKKSDKVSSEDQAVAKDLVEYLSVAWKYAEGEDDKTAAIESWMDLVAKLADLGEGYVVGVLTMQKLLDDQPEESE